MELLNPIGSPRWISSGGFHARKDIIHPPFERKGKQILRRQRTNELAAPTVTI